MIFFNNFIEQLEFGVLSAYYLTIIRKNNKVSQLLYMQGEKKSRKIKTKSKEQNKTKKEKPMKIL